MRDFLVPNLYDFIIGYTSRFCCKIAGFFYLAQTHFKFVAQHWNLGHRKVPPFHFLLVFISSQSDHLKCSAAIFVGDVCDEGKKEATQREIEVLLINTIGFTFICCSILIVQKDRLKNKEPINIINHYTWSQLFITKKA